MAHPMNCPRCVRDLPSAALTCGECGFSLHDQDAQFGQDAVRLDRVANPAGSLSEADIRTLEQALDAFQETFPQLFLAIYNVALPVMSSVRQFGFWLLNRAAIKDLDITRPNENGALLVLDETTGQAGLVVGYLLECYFSEPELAELLEPARKDWAAGSLAAGALEVIAAFTKALKKKAKLAQRDPTQFAPLDDTPPGKPEFDRVHPPVSEQPLPMEKEGT